MKLIDAFNCFFIEFFLKVLLREKFIVKYEIKMIFNLKK